MPVPAVKSQPVPLLDLSRQYAGIREEVLAAIERVCASQKFILGAEVEALEYEIAALTGAKYAVGCASGTDALWLALTANDIGPGDRVITTPFSFFASASSIIRTGAEPVFVDVEPGTLNIAPQPVAAALQKLGASKPRRGQIRRSSRLLARPPSGRIRNDSRDRGAKGVIRAILPVHLYGQCADMDALRQIADEHGLILIEDAAQAIGAKWRGKPAGSLGTAAAFSFYPTKNLSAYGDAGMVITQSADMAERMRRLRNHGSPERYLHTEIGWNARMDAIQAAVLRVKLKHIEEWNRQRRERAELYDRLLAEAGLCSPPRTRASVTKRSSAAGAGTPRSAPAPVQRLQTSPHAFHVFHQYVIRVERRDELRKFLSARGIGTEVYYPLPLHLQPVFAFLGYRKGDLPESERAGEEVLALPMFPELTEAEQRRVVQEIAEFYG